MTRAHRSAVSPVCAHRRTCPARSLAPCATHPRTSDSPLLGHTRWSPEGAKGTGTAPERSAELLLRARKAPYGGRRGKERRVQAQRCRRGPGRAGILGLAPCYAPNGFGGCSPAVFRPCPALLPLARLTAGHRPCFPPMLGSARSDPSAAATTRPRALHCTALPQPLPQPRRRPRSISRSLRVGGRAAAGGARGAGICLDGRRRRPMGSGEGRAGAAAAQCAARPGVMRVPAGYKGGCVRTGPSLTQYGRRH